MIANLLTLTRIALAVPLFWLLQSDGGYHRWAALCVFLLAGLTDVADGYLARRLGETSAFGAMFDLLADRLLTLALVAAFLANGQLTKVMIAVAMVLVIRDFVVAGLNEALPGRLDIRVTLLERVKISCQFFGFGFLIVPDFRLPDVSLYANSFGVVALMAAAALALVSLVDYAGRARKAFATARPEPA